MLNLIKILEVELLFLVKKKSFETEIHCFLSRLSDPLMPRLRRR